MSNGAMEQTVRSGSTTTLPSRARLDCKGIVGTLTNGKLSYINYKLHFPKNRPKWWEESLSAILCTTLQLAIATLPLLAMLASLLFKEAKIYLAPHAKTVGILSVPYKKGNYST